MKQSTTLLCAVLTDYFQMNHIKSIKIQNADHFQWWFNAAPTSMWTSACLSKGFCIYFFKLLFAWNSDNNKRTSATFLVSWACKWDSHYSPWDLLQLQRMYTSRWNNITFIDLKLEGHILFNEQVLVWSLEHCTKIHIIQFR